MLAHPIPDFCRRVAERALNPEVSLTTINGLSDGGEVTATQLGYKQRSVRKHHRRSSGGLQRTAVQSPWIMHALITAQVAT